MTLRQRLKCTHFFEFGKKIASSYESHAALELGHPIKYAIHETGLDLPGSFQVTPMLCVGCRTPRGNKPIYAAKPIYQGLTFVLAATGGKGSPVPFISSLDKGLAKLKPDNRSSGGDTPYPLLSPLTKVELGIRSITNPLTPEVVDSKGLVGEDIFWNVCFDKGRLKNFVSWFLQIYGEYKTIQLVEQLKNVGFEYATKAGISLGIEDLKIPPRKADLILEAEKLTKVTITQYNRGEISGVERFQRLIDTWHRTSELLKQEVIDNFEVTDILNPVYMMAFSGARGNISQVRQLVGMRGLMADPQGQIIDFPIRSNFREGLTLTEYIISSYGARKGIVDTALRTANAGYLTRRLVDVAQHVVVSQYDCGTNRGLFLTEMKESNKIIYSLQNRLIGRVLAKDIYESVGFASLAKGIFSNQKIASRNQEVSTDLAFTISKNCTKVFVRSSLTCETKKLVCQLCYGWSLAQGSLVSIGEAVGIVAAQSIGEPGTQLTMRTFHTGGVFSGDVSEQIRAPYDGYVQYSSSIAGTLIRTAEGQIAFLTKNEAMLFVLKASYPITIFNDLSLVNANDAANNPPPSHTINTKDIRKYKIPAYTVLFIRNNENVFEKQVIAQISSISRQKNIRDDAELTIKAEMEGQFYSKTLTLQRKLVGPKLKDPTEKELQTILDPVVEARDWSFAWILSGKIYELPMPTSFFPQQGDFINTSCTVNQTRWLLASHGGMVSYLYVSNFELNKKRKVALGLSCSEVKDELKKTNKDSLQGLGNLAEEKKVTLRTPMVHFLSLRAKLTGGNNKRVVWSPYPYGVPPLWGGVPKGSLLYPEGVRGEVMLPVFAKVAYGEKKSSKSNKTRIMGVKTSSNFIRKAHPSFVKKPVFFLNIQKIQYHNIGYVLDIPSSIYFGYAKDSFILPFPEGVGQVGRSLGRGSTFAPPLTPSSLIKSNDFIFTAHSLQPKGITHTTLQNYQSSKDNEYTWRRRTDFVASLGQSHKSLSPSISAAGEPKSELFSQEFGENMVKHKSNYNGSMASNNKQNALSLSATNWNPSMSKFIQWLPQKSSIKTAGLFIFEHTIKSVADGWLGVSVKTLHQKPIPISPLSLNIKEGLEGSKKKVKIKPIFMKWFKQPNIYLANPGISNIKKKHYQVSYKKKCNWFNTNHENRSLDGSKLFSSMSFRHPIGGNAECIRFRSKVQFHVSDSRRYVYTTLAGCAKPVNPPLEIQDLSYLYPTVDTVKRNKASKTSPHATWLPNAGIGHPHVMHKTAAHVLHKGPGQSSITWSPYPYRVDGKLPEVHSKIRLNYMLGRVISATGVGTTHSYNALGRQSFIFYIGKLLSNFILPPHYLGLHDQKDPKYGWGATGGLEVNSKPHKGVSLQNPTSNNKFLATQRFFYMPQPCYKLNKQETCLHNPYATWLPTAGLDHPYAMQGTSAHATKKGGQIKEAVKTKKPLFHMNKNHYNSMRSYFFCVTTFKPCYLQTKDAFNGLYLNPNQVKLGLYHSRTSVSLTYLRPTPMGWSGGEVGQSPVGSGINDLDKPSRPYYSNLSLTYPNLNERQVRVSSSANPVKGHGTNPWHNPQGYLFSSTSKGVEQKSEKYLEKLHQEETKVAPTLLSYLKKRPNFFNSKLGENSPLRGRHPIQLLETPPLPPIPQHGRDRDITPLGTQPLGVVYDRGTHEPCFAKPTTLKLLELSRDHSIAVLKGDNMDLKQRFGKNREWLEKDLKADILLGAAKQTQSDNNVLLIKPYNVSLSIKDGLKIQKQPVKSYLLSITYWKKWNYSLQNLLVQTLFQTYSLFIKLHPTFFYLKDKVELLGLFYNHYYLLPMVALPLRAGFAKPSQAPIGTPSGLCQQKTACEIKVNNKNLFNSPYLYTTCNQQLCCFLESKMKKIPCFINKGIRFVLPPIGQHYSLPSREDISSGADKMVNNLYSHVTFKKGWVYKPTNMSDALKYDKKVILAGELLLDHIIFDRLPSSAIYIECVHLKEKKTKHNLLSGFLWNKTSPWYNPHRDSTLAKNGIKTKGYPFGELPSVSKVPVAVYPECVGVAATSLQTGVIGSNIPSAGSIEIENQNNNLKRGLLWIKNIKPRFGSSIFRLLDPDPILRMGSRAGEGGLEIKYPNPFSHTNDDACLRQNAAFVIVFRKIEQYNLIEPLNNKLNVQNLLLTSLQSIKIKPCLTLFSGKMIKTIGSIREPSNSSVLLSQPPVAVLRERDFVVKKIQMKSKVFFINKKLNSLSLQNLYRSSIFSKQLKTAEIVASLPNIDFYIEQNLLWEDLRFDKSSSSNLTVGNPMQSITSAPDRTSYGRGYGRLPSHAMLPEVASAQATSFSPEATSGHFQVPPPLEGDSLAADSLYNNQITKQKKSYSFAWSYRPLNFNSFTVHYKNLNFLRVTSPNTNEITLKTASPLTQALALLEPEKEPVASDSHMLRMGLRSNQGAHILFNYKKQAPFHISFYKTSIKNTPNWQCFSTLLKSLIQTGFLILKKQMLWHRLSPRGGVSSTGGRDLSRMYAAGVRGEVRLERTKLNLRKLRLKKDILSSIQSIIPILFDSPCLDLNIKSTLLVNKNGFFASKSINCSTTEGSVLVSASKNKELSKTKFYVSLGNNLICSTPVAQTSFFSAFEGELLTFSQPKLKRNPLLQSLKRQDALTWHPDWATLDSQREPTGSNAPLPEVGVRLSNINQAYFGFDNFISSPTWLRKGNPYAMHGLPSHAMLPVPCFANVVAGGQASDIRLEQPTKPVYDPLNTKDNDDMQSAQVFANSCLVLTKKDLVSFTSVFTQSSSTLKGIKQQGKNKSKRLRLGDFYLHGDLLESLDASNKTTGLNVSGQIVHLSTVIYPSTTPNGLKVSMGGGDTRPMFNLKKYHTGYSSFSLQNPAPTYPFYFKPLGTCETFITVSMQKSGLEESTLPLTSNTVLPSLSPAIESNKDTDETNITNLQGGLPLVIDLPKEAHELRTVITLRRAQPIFISPKGVFHVHEGGFIQNKAPVITLAYQRLKTGDIIEGIPKVEQFFEARTTKRGRLFKDSLPNLLKGLFGRYRKKSFKSNLPKRIRDHATHVQLNLQSRSLANGVTRKARELHKTLSLDQAVRQSFYKIQQIIVDGVQRVYRSQGAAIADKHLEVIVKQMTSKVKIVKGGQTGFFPGELVDFEFIGHVNTMLLIKVQYQPVVVGITRASLQVNSFLSAASFQQTTRILSEAAINKRQDFLKGLKENVMLGNLIPAGTGYLVYLDF